MAPMCGLGCVLVGLAWMSTGALGSSSPSSITPRGRQLRARHTHPAGHVKLAKVKRQALASLAPSSSSAVAIVETSAAAAVAATTSSAAPSSTTSQPAVVAQTTTTTTTTEAAQTTTTTTSQPPTTTQPTTTTTTQAATIKTTTTTTKSTHSTTSSSVVSVVVVTAVITNSNGVVSTSTSSSLSTPAASSTVKPKNNTSSSSTGRTWGIIGGVAGGVVALLGVLFIAYRLSQRRFSNLDHGGADGDIRWPQLQMDGQMVAAGASTLRPMGTRRTGGAGIEMDGDKDEDNQSDWHGSDAANGANPTRSTEHLNHAFGYQDGFVVGNDVYSGRPPPPPSSVSDHGFPVGAMPAYPPATMNPGQYAQSQSHFAPSLSGTAPPSFDQHQQHQNFIPAYPRPTDQRGDATFEFMTGQSDTGHSQPEYATAPGPGLHRNPSSYSQATDLHRNNSNYSQHTQLPPFSDGLSRSGSGYSFAHHAGHSMSQAQGMMQVQGPPVGMAMGGPGLHRNDTVFSQGSVYSQQTHAHPHAHMPGPPQRVSSPRALSPRVPHSASGGAW